MKGKEKRVSIRESRQKMRIAPAPPIDKFSKIKNKRNVSFENGDTKQGGGDQSTIIEQTMNQEDLSMMGMLPTVQDNKLGDSVEFGDYGHRATRDFSKPTTSHIGLRDKSSSTIFDSLAVPDQQASARIKINFAHQPERKPAFAKKSFITKRDHIRKAAIQPRVYPIISDQTKYGSSDQDRKTSITDSTWKTKYDGQQVYNIEKSFEISNQHQEWVKGLMRWRNSDVKGNRKNMYTKELLAKNVNIHTVVNQSRLEQAHTYTDTYKCLPFRKRVIKFKIHISDFATMIVKNKQFEAFIILIIGLNCITLAMSDSTKEETEAEANIEIIFQVLYTMEMVLRICSLGFVINKGAYLRSYWNQLDFICVVTGYIGMFGGGGASLAGIRAFRVLRPLRTVNQIEALKTVVQSVMGAVALLQDTIIILLFFMLIFAIGGLNLFMGMLLQRCIHIETGDLLLDEDGIGVICGYDVCPTGYFCGKSTLNPNNDVTNFDNIFWALLNVFQCITLEGWSEIMVMYQKAYTPLVFFFFVALVFIGAFFFLNLTLAVINSSYSEAQARIKAQKEKLRQEQNQIRGGKKSKSDDDNYEDQIGKDSKKDNKLGVAEFFVAKRAAKKLKAYWHMHQEKKQREEDQARKEAEYEKIRFKKAEKEAEIRRAQLLKNQKTKKNKVADSNASLNNSQVNSSSSKQQASRIILVDNLPRSESSFAVDNVEERVMMEDGQGSNKVKPISEANLFSEEADEYENDVMNFLKEVDNGIIKLEKDVPERLSLSTVKQGSGGMTPIPTNALSDVRIIKGMTDSKQLSRRNLPSVQKVSQFHKKRGLSQLQLNEQSENEDQQFEMMKELDFDKVVQQIEIGKDSSDSYNQVGRHLSQDDIAGVAEQHPFDLSFATGNISLRKDAENGSAGRNRSKTPVEDYKRQQDVDEDDQDFVSSIISSDESIEDKLRELKVHKEMSSKSPQRQRGSELMMAKIQQSREVDQKIRRMLTVDETKKEGRGRIHESMDNNSFIENIPGFRKQADLLSGLQLDKNSTLNFNQMSKNQRDHNDQTLLTGRQSQGSQPLSISKKKLEHRKVIQELDKEYFSKEQPTNPSEFIEKHQKVVINPGVPYRSTSLSEIFENRFNLNEADKLKKINSFIAAQQDEIPKDVGLYEDVEEENFVRVAHEAYQLKTVYKVKQADEINWEDEEEDAMILAEQPYETAMSTGFKDFLSHLTTKFVARRSDIIVSSTLSITLTPQDDGIVPTSFAQIKKTQIDQFIELKEEFRALKVTSNDIKLLPLRKLRHDRSVSAFESSVEMIKQRSEESSMSEDQMFMEDQSDGNYLRRLTNIESNQVRLPDTLLNEPLKPSQKARLTEQSLKLYNMQKAKWDLGQKMISKRVQHPRDEKFGLKEARQLIEGTYHEEDEISEDLFVPKALQDMDTSMRQQREDIRATAAVSDLTKMAKELLKQGDKNIDPRQKVDNIPNELKVAFNLPKDMLGLEIDFMEVRIVDAQFKKRLPVWSGQEVLEQTLNMKKSAWVLNQINATRVWPKGAYNSIKKARSLLKAFTRTSFFDNLMTFCVLVNTIGMSMESYDIDPKVASDIEFLNTIFTWIFIAEMSMKLLARGVKKYAAERMNLLDGAVVTISIIEMVMQAQGSGGGAGNLQAFRTVRVFRTFRVLRVTRILRSLKSMAMIIGVIQRAFMDFIWITILMFVFIFIYTLLGRQIFQGRFVLGPDEELPRANFESFTIAFITVFQVLTMENWQQVLYTSMGLAEGSMIFKTIVSMYYISWIFIGNFILLNLFLAILIDSFGEADAELETEEDGQAQEELQAIHQKKVEAQRWKRMRNLGHSEDALHQMKLEKQKNDLQNGAKTQKKKSKASFTGGGRTNRETFEEVEDLDNKAVRMLLIQQGILKAKKGEIDEKNIGMDIAAENSVYLFNRNSCFRRNVFYIQKHRYFDRFIMILIALSSMKLALESYFVDEPEDSQIKIISSELDFVFNYAFIFECILKTIALGFTMDEGSYLRDSWNGLDFFIVSTSIIDMLLASTDIPALKVLRLLRMIRPLRVISHNPQLKMIVAALFESVGSIINVSVVVLIIWMMFAIYGMNTYMGMFFYCSKEPYKLNTRWVCQDAGGEWLRFDSNFDNIGQAMVTLFIVSSLEGWPDIMHQAIDITKRDNGPVKENSPGQMFFFIIFILIGSFFFLNFFIGVLFLKYEQAQKREEAGFNKRQLYWLELQRLIIEAETPHELRYKPQTNPRLDVYHFVQSSAFEVTIMIFIVLNMLQMALDHEGASPQIIMFLKVSNYIFTAIFFMEATIKLYVYRLAYFKNGWNKFDFFVVISSLIDLGIDLILNSIVEEGGQQQSSSLLTVGPQLARVLRVLRVSRVLRLAGKYKGLQSLLKTIQMSVSSLINVFILLMLIFFIMAVLGNSLFFRVTEGNVISSWKNFTNFHQSFSLLFSISTGEDWNRIMYDCMNTDSDCIPGKTCGTDIAPFFFLSFILLVTHIMLNLFVLVIIQQFSKYYIEDDNPRARFEEDFEDFKEAWRHNTGRYQCMKLKVKHVNDFFNRLPQRIRQKMGVAEGSRDLDVQRIIIKMGINVDDGFIYFNEMLYRVMRAQFGQVRFNKVMALNELVTQFRIMELTMKTKEQTSKQVNQELTFLKQRRTTPVNPLLAMMFLKTSFLSWMNYADECKRKQIWEQKIDEKRQLYKDLGKEFVEPVFPANRAPMEIVEVEKEVEIEITTDEDDDFFNKSRRNGTLSQSADKTSSKTALLNNSPEAFRAKARHRNWRTDFKLAMNQSSMKEMLESSPDIHKNSSHKKKLSPTRILSLNSKENQAFALQLKINKHQNERKDIKSLGFTLEKPKPDTDRSQDVNQRRGLPQQPQIQRSLTFSKVSQ